MNRILSKNNNINNVGVITQSFRMSTTKLQSKNWFQNRDLRTKNAHAEIQQKFLKWCADTQKQHYETLYL